MEVLKGKDFIDLGLHLDFSNSDLDFSLLSSKFQVSNSSVEPTLALKFLFNYAFYFCSQFNDFVCV